MNTRRLHLREGAEQRYGTVARTADGCYVLTSARTFHVLTEYNAQGHIVGRRHLDRADLAAALAEAQGIIDREEWINPIGPSLPIAPPLPGD